jgi:hypothetical protein
MTFEGTFRVDRPRLHFLVHDIEVFQYRVSGTNGRSGTNHRAVHLVASFADPDPTRDEPVTRCDHGVFGKHLQSSHFWDIVPKRIALKEGVASIGHEDRARTAFTILESIPEQRIPPPPNFDVGVWINTRVAFLFFCSVDFVFFKDVLMTVDKF